MYLRNFVSFVLSIALVLANAAVLASASEDKEEADAPMRFGMDSASISAQNREGVPPEYGTLWIGPWTLKSGWGGPGNSLTGMRDLGVTPAIHFYYWGDDISPSCVENGCWSDLHNAHKDRDGWQQLANELVDALHKYMKGEPVLVLMETEFNKAGIEFYKPFDNYLKNKTEFINQGYPAAETVMALGNWNPEHWNTFSATAEVSDYVGLQGMRGSTRDSLSNYNSIFTETARGAETLQDLFDKPTILFDLALSTHPEPEYLAHQSNVLEDFFRGIPRLKAAGLEAIIYRAWTDHPTKDMNNYYGIAERHWGLAWSQDSGPKPGGEVWITGVMAERAGESYPTPPRALEAKFIPLSNSSEWWMQIRVEANNELVWVQFRASGGPWQDLPEQSWGDWSKGIHILEGTEVDFRAKDVHGQLVHSPTFLWLQGEKPDGYEPPEEPEPGPLSATFRPASASGEWWVEVFVDANKPITRVQAKIDGGSWTNLHEQSWGAWARSIHVPKGTEVIFRATDQDGERVSSATYLWLQGEKPDDYEPPEEPEPGPLSAKFNPASGSGEWWVEVFVDANKPITRVQAKIDGGSWTNLHEQSWGAWARSIHVPKGTEVIFRATDETGERVTSPTYLWLEGEKPKGHEPPKEPEPGPLSATFRSASGSGEWWVEVFVDANKPITRVQAKIDGGSWTNLHEQSWGAWARSIHVPKGTEVTFRATDQDGERVSSATYLWLQGEKPDDYEPPEEPEPGPLSATFRSASGSGEWWVEVFVDANKPITRVQAKIDGGSWTNLHEQSWGAWARSIHVPKGTEVIFRATDEQGERVTSPIHLWLQGEKPENYEPPKEPEPGPLSAKFNPASGSGEWWVEVFVDANKPITRVQAKIDDGSWTNLPEQSWGAWARSIHVPKGTEVIFRATDVDGERVTSPTYLWLEGEKPGPLTATFTPASGANHWWVEVFVTSDNRIERVQAKIDGGSWQNLPEQSWGAWAKSIHVPAGSEVVFRATDTQGQRAVSDPFTW